MLLSAPGVLADDAKAPITVTRDAPQLNRIMVQTRSPRDQNTWRSWLSQNHFQAAAIESLGRIWMVTLPNAAEAARLTQVLNQQGWVFWVRQDSPMPDMPIPQPVIEPAPASKIGAMPQAEKGIYQKSSVLPSQKSDSVTGEIVRDPLFAQQYQMGYHGEAIGGLLGIAQVNTRIHEAWAITKGAGARIAINDSGTVHHPDLPSFTGYEPSGPGSRDYYPDDEGRVGQSTGTHGTAVAGIVAAQHNDIGGRGVAPEADIFVMNRKSTIADSVAGLYWALEQNVGVVNNSWGQPFECATQFEPALEAVILDHYHEGRGGLGSLQVFATGNTGTNCVAPTARHPATIAVGAMGFHGILSDYTTHGNGMELVAPSEDYSGTGGERIYYAPGVVTTDLPGDLGYSLDDYTNLFSGTSAAAPVVTGVIGLMLSANPDITAYQIRQILRATATDFGAPGYDWTYGYGLVNAKAAVEQAEALISHPAITLQANQYLLPPGGEAAFRTTLINARPADVSEYQWDFGDGSPVATGATPRHRFEKPGTYRVSLKAQIGTQQVMTEGFVTVADDQRRAPDIYMRSVDKGIGIAPYTVRFLASYGHSIASVHAEIWNNKNTYAQWLAGDNNAAGTGTSFTHTYLFPGDYQASFNVSTPDGVTTTVHYPIKVYAEGELQPPKAVISVIPVAGMPLTYDIHAGASIASEKAGITGYSWQINGEQWRRAALRRTFASESQVTLSLYVTDAAGLSGFATTTFMAKRSDAALPVSSSSAAHSAQSSGLSTMSSSAVSSVTVSSVTVSSIAVPSSAAVSSASSRPSVATSSSAMSFAASSMSAATSLQSSSASSSASPADTRDDDKDGVPNSQDTCPDTGPGVEVQRNGCKAIKLGAMPGSVWFWLLLLVAARPLNAWVSSNNAMPPGAKQ